MNPSGHCNSENRFRFPEDFKCTTSYRIPFRFLRLTRRQVSPDRILRAGSRKALRTGQGALKDQIVPMLLFSRVNFFIFTLSKIGGKVTICQRYLYLFFSRFLFSVFIHTPFYLNVIYNKKFHLFSSFQDNCSSTMIVI